MADLIERQALIDAHYEYCNKHPEAEFHVWSLELMQNAPSAQPEIIRCKDCKQFRRWIDTDTCFCDVTEAEISDNDFCSKAERRTDG